jgi:hypothetical protein
MDAVPRFPISVCSATRRNRHVSMTRWSGLSRRRAEPRSDRDGLERATHAHDACVEPQARLGVTLRLRERIYTQGRRLTILHLSGSWRKSRRARKRRPERAVPVVGHRSESRLVLPSNSIRKAPPAKPASQMGGLRMLLAASGQQRCRPPSTTRSVLTKMMRKPSASSGASGTCRWPKPRPVEAPHRSARERTLRA